MNDKLKILIASRSFFPQNSPRSFRTTELAKEFARQGHFVTLLTVKDPMVHNDFEKEHNITIKDIGPLRFKRIYIGNKWLSHKLNRLLKMLFEYPDIEFIFKYKKALKKENNYDLLISVAVPHPVHWGTARARSQKHPIAKVWVADCGDPYYKNTLESFRIPFYFAWVEKYFCRKADYISIPFESLKNSFFTKFHKKIRVIPQGFNFAEINLPKTKTIHPHPTFAYAGGVSTSGVRSLFPFLNILLNTDKDFSFHIYPTQNKDLLENYAAKSNGKIIIHNPLTRNKLLPELAQMDFLVNLIINNTGTPQIPSKLIDYSLANRPILNINPIKPDQNLIKEFLDNNYTNSFKLYNINDYNIINVCNSFISLVS